MRRPPHLNTTHPMQYAFMVLASVHTDADPWTLLRAGTAAAHALVHAERRVDGLPVRSRPALRRAIGAAWAALSRAIGAARAHYEHTSGDACIASRAYLNRAVTPLDRAIARLAEDEVLEAECALGRVAALLHKQQACAKEYAAKV